MGPWLESSMAPGTWGPKRRPIARRWREWFACSRSSRPSTRPAGRRTGGGNPGERGYVGGRPRRQRSRRRLQVRDVANEAERPEAGLCVRTRGGGRRRQGRPGGPGADRPGDREPGRRRSKARISTWPCVPPLGPTSWPRAPSRGCWRPSPAFTPFAASRTKRSSIRRGRCASPATTRRRSSSRPWRSTARRPPAGSAPRRPRPFCQAVAAVA